METRRTWLDANKLIIARRDSEPSDRTLPIYAATLPYWRTPPIRWGASLRALHAQGFTTVATHVPWREHAPEPGTHLFTGDHDLPRFLDAARTAGLSVILRPGPIGPIDLTSFGIPDWVLTDAATHARTTHDTSAWFPLPPRAFPIPSLASQQFHTHVRAWYAALAAAVTPHLAPDGPIVALAHDTSPHFLRRGAFDLDYHPDALEWWRDASGLDEPPRSYAATDAARCILWLKFQDDYAERARTVFDRMLNEAGFAHIARLPTTWPSYVARPQLPDVRRRASHRSNAVSVEITADFIPWLPPLDTAEDTTRTRDELLSLLAGGARAFTLSARTPLDAPWLKPLLAALAEVDWPSLHRHTPIALVAPRADERFAILTNVLDPVPPVLADALQLGPTGIAELGTDPSAVAARRWHTALARALELAQVPYALVDESTPESELASFKAVVAPTLDRIDRGLFHSLRALVEHKRAIVVIGPSSPTKDELDQPLVDPLPKRVGKLKAGSLEDLPGLAEDLAALAGDLPEAWQIERPDDVRAFAYADASHAVRVVFVASDADRATTAVLLAEGRALRDPIAKESVKIDAGRATIPMPARGVRMLIVEP